MLTHPAVAREELAVGPIPTRLRAINGATC
jgi:hypothetical protein